MTTSSRTDRSAFHREIMKKRLRMQDQDLQKADDAAHNLTTVDKRLSGHSCSDCTFRLRSGFFNLCKKQNMKQIKLYNICHRHQQRES